MRYVAFTDPAGTESDSGPASFGTRIAQAPDPVPERGEVLIQVEAAGVSLALYRALQTISGGRGGIAAYPFGQGGPGGELVGTIVALGEGVGNFRVGDRVGGICGGVYADVVACDPVLLTKVPADIDAADALTLVRGGLVALSVVRAGALREGESVLATSAASGVGHLVVQLAKHFGAGRISAVVSGGVGSPKADLAAACGADEVHGYKEESWGKRVDLALDAAGGTAVQRGVDTLAPRGRLVAYSGGGGDIEVNTLLAELKTVTGFSIALLARTDPDEIVRRRDELWQLLADGRLRPAHRVFPAERMTEAIDLVATRANAGRVVLTF